MDQPVMDRVVEALQNDPRTKGYRIDVAHDRGIVSLRGRVKNAGDREAVEMVARQQPGVVTVINEITIG